MDEFETIVEIISEFLGDPKKVYENTSQVSWDCPVCDEDKHKGNLEVNIDKGVFHCWSCGDSENTHGTLNKLFDKYGNRKQKKLYQVLKPETVVKREKTKKKLKLPNGFTLLKDSSPVYPVRRQAINYLYNRGISDYMIEKYQIGFCDVGDHGGRIIIPSYDKSGELNYYIARSWDPMSRAKYRNPEVEKDKIIFWENLIDWNRDIILVEGAFDGLFLDNAIPMLGKHMSELLFETIYKKAKGNITICLDADAWQNSVKLYHELNGGDLWGKIKLVKLPDDKDIADLRGEIKDEYYYIIK
jgi:DNA primase